MSQKEIPVVAKFLQVLVQGKESAETLWTSLIAREGARDNDYLPCASVKLSPKMKVVITYVSDDGVNGVVGHNRGQKGVDVMDMGSWVTADLGRSTDRRQAKISHHLANG